MKNFLFRPTLTLEFQTSVFKLLIYNYVIVLIIANQNLSWNFPHEDNDLAKRLGHELIEPTVLIKFGFSFRFLTVVLNTLAVATLLEPKREKRKFLLPCILWNVYIITALTENIIEIIWSMSQLELKIRQYSTIFIMGIFMLALQTKLTLQAVRFYEYLNYIYV